LDTLEENIGRLHQTIDGLADGEILFRVQELLIGLS
jgi:hypothetical protein